MRTPLPHPSYDSAVDECDTIRQLVEGLASREMPVEDEWALARRLSAAHARQMEESVVLYAGTNLASPAVEAALAGSMGTLPAMGRPWAKDQPGTAAISALEVLVEHQLQALFGAAWAEARLPSATLANLAVYRAFCGKGAPLVATAAPNLGHASHLREGTPGLLDIEVITLPFEEDGITVDETAACVLVERVRPGLLMLGATLVLTDGYPERLIRHARSLGITVAYDASHVAGLIAGRQMRNPFDVGAQLITASTYKSFGGPPGGVILGSDTAHADALRTIVCPQLSSNYDATRLSGLSVACAEARLHMADYSQRMVWSADLLHGFLHKRRVPLLDRPAGTGLHQILLPLGTVDAATRAMRDLEACHILAGVQRVPDRRSGAAYGLRLGTQLLARHRYDAEALDAVAGLLSRVLTHGPSSMAQQEATALARRFSPLHYCFDVAAVEAAHSFL